MRAPVGHLATGEVPPAHPPHPLGAKGAVGGLIEPGIPVEAGRNRLSRRERRRRRGGAAVVHRADLEERSEPPVADELARQPVDLHRALLRPHLDDAVVPPGRLDQRPPLRHVERQRLLGVDILPRLTGMDAGKHALKLPRSHDHRIDVGAVEDPPVVDVHRPRAPLLLPEGMRPRHIDIAQRHDVGPLRQLLEEERRAPADADGADAEPFIGPRGRSPHARQEGDARRGPRPEEQGPPINADPTANPGHLPPSWMNTKPPFLFPITMSGRLSPLRSPTASCVPTPEASSILCAVHETFLSASR